MIQDRFLEKVKAYVEVPINKETTADECAELAHSFAKNGTLFEAIIALACMYQKTDDHEKVFDLAVQLVNCDKNQFLRMKDEQDLESSAWGSKKDCEWNYFFHQTIECCIRFPCTYAATIVVLLSDLHQEEIQKNDQTELFRKLKFFCKKDDQVNGLELMNLLSNIPKYVKKRQEHYQDVIELIVNKFKNLEDNKSWLIALWVYYLYLDEDSITECISKILISEKIDTEEEYVKFMQEQKWPWLSHEALTAFYTRQVEKLSGISKGKRTVIPQEIRLLPNALLYMIPTILYAKNQDNSEAASILLWKCCSRCDFPGVIDRMEEINGGLTISSEFKKLSFSSRLTWFTKRAQIVFSRNGQSGTPGEWARYCLKETFALQPLNTIFVELAMKVGKSENRTEFRDMYMFSISKMTSHFALSVMLTNNAKFIRNEHAFKLILMRMDELGYYSSMLYVAEKLLEKAADLTQSIVRFVGLILKVCEAVEQNKLNKQRFEDAQRQFERFHQLIKEVFTEQELAEIRETKFALRRLMDRDYNSLFELSNNKNVSISVLEVILRGALQLKNHYKVFEIYRRMAKIDRNRAVFYNQDVKFHIFLLNRNRKEKVEYGLVSGIWQIPVYLENPVNATARKVAFTKDN